MRRACRTDANQQSVIDALEAVGCVVTILSDQGNGVPDLLVGLQRPKRLVLIEVKDGNQEPARRALTPAQKRFHALYAGWPVYVANSVSDALAIVGCGPKAAA